MGKWIRKLSLTDGIDARVGSPAPFVSSRDVEDALKLVDAAMSCGYLCILVVDRFRQPVLECLHLVPHPLYLFLEGGASPGSTADQLLQLGIRGHRDGQLRAASRYS